MLWFKRAKKQRPYPYVYSEWLVEFKRLKDSLLRAEDAALLSGGVLSDGKYTLQNFVPELRTFLERQVELFFGQYKREIQIGLDEGNCEYLLLVIRRHHLRYRNLLFFRELAFLDVCLRNDLSAELNEKLRQYHCDLLGYFKKLSDYTDSMYQVSVNIQRLMEV